MDAAIIRLSTVYRLAADDWSAEQIGPWLTKGNM
jgi:hypothetical protein